MERKFVTLVNFHIRRSEYLCETFRLSQIFLIEKGYFMNRKKYKEVKNPFIPEMRN